MIFFNEHLNQSEIIKHIRKLRDFKEFLGEFNKIVRPGHQRAYKQHWVLRVLTHQAKLKSFGLQDIEKPCIFHLIGIFFHGHQYNVRVRGQKIRC